MKNNCLEVLEKNWEKIKSELSSKGIISISIFMNLIFQDLTDKLIKFENINTINNLLEIEEYLEKIINLKLREYEDYKKIYEKLNKEDRNKDLEFPENLLNEKYDWNLYDEKIYPDYKYFTFNNLPDKKIQINDDKKNILLKWYLYEKKNDVKQLKHLKTLDIFNPFINIILKT